MIIIVDIVSWIVGIAGIAAAAFFGYKLRQWELLLSATVAIAYKGKIKMRPSLLEMLKWALAVSKSEKENARTFYKLGGTDIAIVQPRDKTHGKAVTKKVATDPGKTVEVVKG
jgi:hypothetical protein